MADDATWLVRRYYLYRATATVGFITPIFTVFLLRDLSFAELGTLSALYSALVVLGEVPTGYVGDYVGRRNSLALAAVFKAASLVGFVVADTFAAFAVLYVLWALGLTFDSGSVSAWLYETLEERLDPADFTRVRGRGESVNRWVGAAAMIGGSLLYVLDPRSPFLLATVWVLLGLPVLVTMPEPGSKAERRTPVREIAGLARGALLRPPLRSFVLFTGLAFGTVSAAQLYVQPIAVDVLSGLVSAGSTPVAGVPPAASLGLLYAAFTAVAAVASDRAASVEGWLGRRRAIAVLTVATAVVMVLPVAVPLLAFPAFFVMRGADPLLRPITQAVLNDELGSAGRATLLSAVSMVYAVVRVPLALGGGVLADATSALAALAAFGGVFLAVGGLLMIGSSPLAATEAGD